MVQFSSASKAILKTLSWKAYKLYKYTSEDIYIATNVHIYNKLRFVLRDQVMENYETFNNKEIAVY